ncbi:MAG: lysoplasmalogenase [Oscillospiraceae bacterium]|jgi:uncharacterized membrane protein YhhN|nr:lysoplasmalogenase [Oscillospiraceae bacterium]
MPASVPSALWGLSAVCFLLAALTGVFRAKGMEKMRILFKTLASMMFCAVGFVALMGREVPQVSVRAVLLLVALLLGLVGDIFLGIDGFIHRDVVNFFFLLGGAPFLFGHIVYVGILLSIGTFEPAYLCILAVLPVLFLLLHYFKVWNLHSNLPPLLCYALVLSAMVMGTLNLARQGGTLGQLMIAPGILFAISDTSLFLGKFGTERIRRLKPLLSFMIMLTYYSAQCLFAISIRYI